MNIEFGGSRPPEPASRDLPAASGPPPSLAAKVVVVIVGYRNANDVVSCLKALALASAEPSFEIFVAENGGGAAMDALLAALAAEPACRLRDLDQDLSIGSPNMVRRCLFDLIDAAGLVRSRAHIAEMAENLGYAGGINAWLGPLLHVQGWEGAWVLNPDTEATPSALSELVAHATRYGRDMVGSRLVTMENADQGYTQGLAWSRPMARTMAVNYPYNPPDAPDQHAVEARIDAPSGASCYVTRQLIERIGLMDEDYFLFFEDLEWGYRAKAQGRVGYAHASIVRHRGGTTTGASRRRGETSPLSTYLEFRNRILFVRRQHPGWLAWTVAMQVLHIARLVTVGSGSTVLPALRGLGAGLQGRTGRPDRAWSALPRAPRPRGSDASSREHTSG